MTVVTHAIAAGTWAIEVPLPVASPPFTLAYALADARGDVHLIDTGWDAPGNLEILTGGLESLGLALDRVRTVTATHMHSDHLGLAERIRELTGARVQLHAVEQAALDVLAGHGTAAPAVDAWGVPDTVRDGLLATIGGTRMAGVTADVLLRHDELLDIPGREVRVLHTPGHTVGSISLAESTHPEALEGLLFTGDLLLPTIFPGIGVGGDSPDPLGDYLASLDLIEGFGDPLVCPGHGYAFRGLRDRVRQTRDHQEGRTSQVRELVREHPDASVWQIASRVTWTDGWEALTGFHLASALAQTAMRMRHLESSSLEA